MSKSISKTYKMENIENTKSTFFPATRGTSFTLEEDILLCNCWATVSIDGNRYTDQQASTMWGSIHLLFNKDKSEEEKRIEPSLKKRWCKINKEVSDYIGFYNQILGLKPNEVNEWDIKKQATSLYLENSPTRVKHWRFDHCYEILKTLPKWMKSVEKRPVSVSEVKKEKGGTPLLPVSSDDSDNEEIIELEHSNEQKEQTNRDDMKRAWIASNDEWNKRLRLTYEETEFLKIERTLLDFRILTFDVTTVPDKERAKELRKMQQNVLDRLKKERATCLEIEE